MKAFLVSIGILFSLQVLAETPTGFITRTAKEGTEEYCAAKSPYKKCSKYSAAECTKIMTDILTECGRNINSEMPSAISSADASKWQPKITTCGVKKFVEKAMAMKPPKFDQMCFMKELEGMVGKEE